MFIQNYYTALFETVLSLAKLLLCECDNHFLNQENVAVEGTADRTDGCNISCVCVFWVMLPAALRLLHQHALVVPAHCVWLHPLCACDIHLGAEVLELPEEIRGDDYQEEFSFGTSQSAV